MPDHTQFNTDRTSPGRWTISLNNPPINMFVPGRRSPSFSSDLKKENTNDN
jgi:hypothetical protein